MTGGRWRVRKNKTATRQPPWVAGNNHRYQSFTTWREAFDYAARQEQ